MEELQVDTGRGILLVKNTLLDVQANRRKIPRIGPRSANKADAGTDAKSAVKSDKKTKT